MTLTTTEALRLILDQVDYTKGACGLSEAVGGCLDKQVIETCHQALAVDRMAAVNADLLTDLRQCKTELEEAANLLRPQLQGMANIYQMAAARVGETIMRAEKS